MEWKYSYEEKQKYQYTHEIGYYIFMWSQTWMWCLFVIRQTNFR